VFFFFQDTIFSFDTKTYFSLSYHQLVFDILKFFYFDCT